jgi:gamma-glutamyltranspeptidase/glutathione hydrolase
VKGGDPEEKNNQASGSSAFHKSFRDFLQEEDNSMRSKVHRTLCSFLALAVLITGSFLIFTPEKAAGEPFVAGRNYAVVSAHYMATQAGFEILRNGGNAADAAVAVAAVIGVVECWFSNVLGGGTWALYYNKSTGKVTALDGVGRTGTHAKTEFFRDPDLNVPFGMHQALVPGAWDGWMIWLEKFGTKDLGEIMAPAIELAENGIPASKSMVAWIGRRQDGILSMPDTKKIFMPGGKIPQVGDVIYQKDLAKTYRALVKAYDDNIHKGRKAAFQAASDYYYRGPLAERVVAFSKANGGHFELSDFNTFNAQFMEPIKINYKGLEVYECPPNSQGITTLMGLNILKGFDFSNAKIDSSETIHKIVEAIKLAYTDNYHYVADPDFYDVPVEELLSDEHAAKQRARIDMDKAITWPIPGGLGERPYTGHTTTYHVVDKYGNGAAVTTSLGAQFLVVGDTGILINNRVPMMEVAEGNPNLTEPKKKVRHTSNPYMTFKDGMLYMLGGNTGGDTQPQGQIQQFMNVVEFGLTAQEAVSRPRYISTCFPAVRHPHRYANQLGLEKGYPDETLAALKAKGHKFAKTALVGNANLIVIDHDRGIITTGGDPRGENLGMVW